MTYEERQETTRWYRVVGTFFVCLIGTNDDGVITTTAPVLRTFKGKHLFQLRRWKQVQRIERMADSNEEE